MEKKRIVEKKREKLELFNFNKAVVLLLILSLIVISITVFTSQKNELSGEAEIVLSTLTDGNTKVSLTESDELIEEKIKNLDQMDYDEIKNIIGVKNDFCIFFEDSSGNLVKIDDINPYIGSNKIYINGDSCK